MKIREIGHDFSQSRCVYIEDCAVIVVAAAKALQIYSRVTGSLLHCLENAHDGSEIVKIQIISGLSRRIVSCGISGSIYFWEWDNDALTLNRLNALNLVDSQILNLHVLNRDVSENLELITLVRITSEKKLRVVTIPFTFTNSEVSVDELRNQTRFKSKIDSSKEFFPALHQFCSSKDGEYVAIAGNGRVTVHSRSNNKVRGLSIPLKINHPLQITSFSFHPIESYLAIGLSDGQILLWYGLEQSCKPVTSTLHWHAHPVRTLDFSGDGTYLLSAGEEAVLVWWQLENGSKHFLPRLGAPINAISTSSKGDTIFLTCADNSVKIIDSVTLSVQKVIRGVFTLDKYSLLKIKKAGGAPLTQMLHSGCIAIPTVLGTVQKYNPWKDLHVRIWDVEKRNYISRKNETDEELAPVRITHAAEAPDSLAFCLNHMGEQYSLELWRDEKTKIMVMENAFEGEVTALCLGPKGDLCILGGQAKKGLKTGGLFKVWRKHVVSVRKNHIDHLQQGVHTAKESIKDEMTSKITWELEGAGSFKDLPIYDLQFSADQSLFAISFGTCATLWNSETLELLHVIPLPLEKSELIQRLFFAGSEHLICGVNGKGVFVWSLCTLALSWFEACDLCAIAGDNSESFALISRGKDAPSQLLILNSSKKNQVLASSELSVPMEGIQLYLKDMEAVIYSPSLGYSKFSLVDKESTPSNISLVAEPSLTSAEMENSGSQKRKPVTSLTLSDLMQSTLKRKR